MIQTLYHLTTQFIIAMAVITMGLVWSPGEIVQAADLSESADGVVLVHMVYQDGQWMLGSNGVRILPCDPPNDFERGTENDPLIRVMAATGKIVYEKNIPDPRLVLYEGPDGQSRLLEKMSYNLRFAYRKGMQTFEFWQNTSDKSNENGPAVKADMRNAVEQLEMAQKSRERFPCQQPQLK